MYIEAQTTNHPFFQLQKSITIYLVYICCNFFYRHLLFQVENLNIATNLKKNPILYIWSIYVAIFFYIDAYFFKLKI
jgi:hypothetical protein